MRNKGEISFTAFDLLNRNTGFHSSVGDNYIEKPGLAGNHFYFILPGEHYTEIDNDKASQHFRKALSLVKTPAERQAIQRKPDGIEHS